MKSWLVIGVLLSSGVWAQSTPEKWLKEINKSLRAHSPYKGNVELQDGELLHYQELNEGTRRVNLNRIGPIEYVFDRYDPNGAPHSVLLKCTDGECATVKWVDNREIDYSYLLFAFREKEEAERMVVTFENLRVSVIRPE